LSYPPETIPVTVRAMSNDSWRKCMWKTVLDALRDPAS
jgi:hypothetical protein